MKTFTSKEAAKLLNISTRTLLRYREMGRIAYCKIGGKVLFTQENIDNAIKNNTVNAK